MKNCLTAMFYFSNGGHVLKNPHISSMPDTLNNNQNFFFGKIVNDNKGQQCQQTQSDGNSSHGHFGKVS